MNEEKPELCREEKVLVIASMRFFAGEANKIRSGKSFSEIIDNAHSLHSRFVHLMREHIFVWDDQRVKELLSQEMAKKLSEHLNLIMFQISCDDKNPSEELQKAADKIELELG